MAYKSGLRFSFFSKSSNVPILQICGVISDTYSIPKSSTELILDLIFEKLPSHPMCTVIIVIITLRSTLWKIRWSLLAGGCVPNPGLVEPRWQPLHTSPIMLSNKQRCKKQQRQKEKKTTKLTAATTHIAHYAFQQTAL